MTKLVIDIPRKTYEHIRSCGGHGIFNIQDDDNLIVTKAIFNGTPLPKGHGRLKDEDKIVKAIEDRVKFLRKNDAIFMRLRKDIDILGCIPKIRCEVPTIIEADKEVEV